MYSENSKIDICLDSFSKQFYNIWVIIRLVSVFETTALLNLPINSNFLWLLLPDLIESLMRLFIAETKVCLRPMGCWGLGTTNWVCRSMLAEFVSLGN